MYKVFACVRCVCVCEECACVRVWGVCVRCSCVCEVYECVRCVWGVFARV